MSQKLKSSKKVKTAPMVGILSIVTNVLLSYLVTLIMLFALAVAVTYSDFPESRSQSVILIITIVNVMLVGLMVARNARINGWLWGATAAFCYMLLLYFIGSIVFGTFMISGSFILLLFIAMLAGALGGIIGINLKKRR